MSDSILIAADIPFSEDFVIRDAVLDKLRQNLLEAPIDTRDALASWRPDADQYQREVISDEANVLRVVAPAGSGKTQTLINRVLHRISNGFSPSRLLLLTFDNAAASSLRTTLERQVGALPPEHRSRIDTLLRDVGVSTLNAFGYRFLKQHAPDEHKKVAVGGQPRWVFRRARAALKKKDAARDAALPQALKDRFYVGLFSVLKNQAHDPRRPDFQRVADSILAELGRPERGLSTLVEDKQLLRSVVQSLIWLFQTYEALLREERLMDFDDQKLRTYAVLQESPRLLQSIQAQYSEVIVDEFQDINYLDFALIKMLAAKASLIVTGDDDQAIYGFRGCSPDYIINLRSHLDRPFASHELRINYRSPQNIVACADKLIRHNATRIPKDPIAHIKQMSLIKVVSAWSADQEARLAVTAIKRVLRAGSGLSYRDIAVLYRTNAQSLPLQLHFILEGLPYVVRQEDNILHNEELEKLIGALRLKRDLAAGQRPSAHDEALAVSAYFRYLNPRDAERVQRFFSRQSDFLAALESPGFFAILPKARQSQLASAVTALLAARNLPKALEVLAGEFRGLRRMIGSLEDVMDESMPLGEIFDVAGGFKGSIADFVETIEAALARAKASNAGKNEDDGVSLLTYFRSKGRQWHTVILTTCNEGLIPHRRAPLEEERRLFYVGMTRPTSNLFVSFLKKACGNAVQPSRFLTEAGIR